MNTDTVQTTRSVDAHERAGDAPQTMTSAEYRAPRIAHRPISIRATRAQHNRLWRHAYGTEPLTEEQLCALLRYVLKDTPQ